jgi:hypothetical protein
VPNLTAAALAFDIFVDLLESLSTNNALMGSLAYIGDAKVQASSMRLKDLYGRPYTLPVLTQGYPFYMTNLAALPAAPTDPLVFGNWQDLVIGFFSELDGSSAFVSP